MDRAAVGVGRKMIRNKLWAAYLDQIAESTSRALNADEHALFNFELLARCTPPEAPTRHLTDGEVCIVSMVAACEVCGRAAWALTHHEVFSMFDDRNPGFEAYVDQLGVTFGTAEWDEEARRIREEARRIAVKAIRPVFEVNA